MVVDHLFRLHFDSPSLIFYHFPNEHILEVQATNISWYVHIVNYSVSGFLLEDWNLSTKKKLLQRGKGLILRRT